MKNLDLTNLKQQYGNFYKYENVELFGKPYNLKIVFESFDDKINDKQIKSYEIFFEYIKTSQEKILEVIKQYFKNIYNVNVNIQKDLTPTTIFFDVDSNWGILFDTPYEEEHGFAIYTDNGKLKAGTQDLFL